MTIFDRLKKRMELDENIFEKTHDELLNIKDCTCAEPDWGLCPYHDKAYDYRFGVRYENVRLKPIHDALIEEVQRLREALAYFAEMDAKSAVLRQTSPAILALAASDKRLEELVGNGSKNL